MAATAGDSASPGPGTFDADGRLHVSDPRIMRALAHPARLAIMDHLIGGAEATATECAEIVGLSPSATSYHLRAMARWGLIEDAPGRGDGRERVWRTRARGFSTGADPDATPAAKTADGELAGLVLDQQEERFRNWLARSAQAPPEWYAVSRMNRHVLLVTPEELARISDAVAAVFEPYERRRRSDPPAGAAPVEAIYRAYPVT